MGLWMARGRGYRAIFVISTLCLISAGCGSSSGQGTSFTPAGDNSGSGGATQPAKPPSTAPAPSTSINYKAAVWVKVDDSESWTDAVIKTVRSKISSFERARDVADFCPGYSKASTHQRENCWLRLIGGVVKFESSFNPSDSFKEPDGNVSVGLMALSPDECPNAPTEAALKNPVQNLICGITIMARYIAADGFIDGPASGRGASKYWSTLRAPYVSGKYHLGKKDEIIPITELYSAY